MDLYAATQQRISAKYSRVRFHRAMCGVVVMWMMVLAVGAVVHGAAPAPAPALSGEAGAGNHVVECERVTGALEPCGTFLVSGRPRPSPGDACCSGAASVVALGSSQAARQAICRCLLSQALGSTGTNSRSPLNSSIAALPSACSMSFPYPPYSNNAAPVDCSRVA